MIQKSIVLMLSCICLAQEGSSQTVAWQMRPTDYSQIERISNHLFKAVRNGKIGLINSDGTVVAPMINDNISDFYEHKALVTCNDGHGERITGCLTDNGTYVGYTDKYYTLNGQKFFSDGLISVQDENGMLGYIDDRGNKVVGFDRKYTRIKPFTEGYAAVMKGKKYVLINKEGDEMKFVYSAGVGAAIAGCTNVYDGKAYCYDEYGGNDRSYFIYDAEKKTLVKTGRVKNTAMDYLYCYQSVTGRTKEVPFEKMRAYSGAKGLIATMLDGGYGYVSDGNIVVPGQFESASQFEDGLAIIGINGNMGILKFVEGTGFGVSVPIETHDFYRGNSVSCSFDLSVPSIWQGKKLDVVLSDSNGSAIVTTNTANSYSFSVSPTDSGQMGYSVVVNADGIRLYEGEVSYSFNKRELCAFCGKDKRQCNGNHPPKSKIVNPCPTCRKGSCKTHCYTCGKKISECKFQGVH